jgi:hypothetical protein
MVVGVDHGVWSGRRADAVTTHTYDRAGNRGEVLNPKAERSGGTPVVNRCTDDSLVVATPTPIIHGPYRSVR